MSVTHASVALTAVGCCKCKATFGMTKEADDSYMENHAWFCCPYCGANQHYAGESDAQRAQRLQRDAEAALQRERAKHDQTRAELRETERRRRAEKGAKTRIKNRVSRGVCPCCNRFFANVHRHMQHQHPGFTAEHAE